MFDGPGVPPIAVPAAPSSHWAFRRHRLLRTLCSESELTAQPVAILPLFQWADARVRLFALSRASNTTRSGIPPGLRYISNPFARNAALTDFARLASRFNILSTPAWFSSEEVLVAVDVRAVCSEFFRPLSATTSRERATLPSSSSSLAPWHPGFAILALGRVDGCGGSSGGGKAASKGGTTAAAVATGALAALSPHFTPPRRRVVSCPSPFWGEVMAAVEAGGSASVVEPAPPGAEGRGLPPSTAPPRRWYSYSAVDSAVAAVSRALVASPAGDWGFRGRSHHAALLEALRFTAYPKQDINVGATLRALTAADGPDYTAVKRAFMPFGTHAPPPSFLTLLNVVLDVNGVISASAPAGFSGGRAGEGSAGFNRASWEADWMQPRTCARANPLRRVRRRYGEVLSLTHMWAHNSYHFLGEALTRLAPIAAFIRSRPGIMVHLWSDPGNKKHGLQRAHTEAIAALGLDSSRIVTGVTISARVLYVPDIVVCARPHPTAIVLAREVIRTAVGLPRSRVHQTPLLAPLAAAAAGRGSRGSGGAAGLLRAAAGARSGVERARRGYSGGAGDDGAEAEEGDDDEGEAESGPREDPDAGSGDDDSGSDSTSSSPRRGRGRRTSDASSGDGRSSSGSSGGGNDDDDDDGGAATGDEDEEEAIAAAAGGSQDIDAEGDDAEAEAEGNERPAPRLRSGGSRSAAAAIARRRLRSGPGEREDEDGASGEGGADEDPGEEEDAAAADAGGDGDAEGSPRRRQRPRGDDAPRTAAGHGGDEGEADAAMDRPRRMAVQADAGGSGDDTATAAEPVPPPRRRAFFRNQRPTKPLPDIDPATIPAAFRASERTAGCLRGITLPDGAPRLRVLLHKRRFSRRILNHVELAAGLARLPADVTVLDDKFLPHQSEMWRQHGEAHVIVAQNGAGLANIHATAAGAALFEVVQYHHLSLHYAHAALALDVDYHGFISRTHKFEDIWVNADEMLAELCAYARAKYGAA